MILSFNSAILSDTPESSVPFCFLFESINRCPSAYIRTRRWPRLPILRCAETFDQNTSKHIKTHQMYVASHNREIGICDPTTGPPVEDAASSLPKDEQWV